MKFEQFGGEPKKETIPLPEDLTEAQRIELRKTISAATDRMLDAGLALEKSLHRGDPRDLSDRLAIKLAQAKDEQDRLKALLETQK